jgi:hypothetical protein
MAPENEQFFASTSHASPASSSGYSSPMATTPALTPEIGSAFLTDISSYLAHDWTRNAWLDHGIQFVG